MLLDPLISTMPSQFHRSLMVLLAYTLVIPATIAAFAKQFRTLNKFVLLPFASPVPMQKGSVRTQCRGRITSFLIY